MSVVFKEDLDPYVWFCSNCMKRNTSSYVDNTDGSVCYGCEKLYEANIMKVNTWREKTIYWELHGVH